MNGIAPFKPKREVLKSPESRNHTTEDVVIGSILFYYLFFKSRVEALGRRERVLRRAGACR